MSGKKKYSEKATPCFKSLRYFKMVYWFVACSVAVVNCLKEASWWVCAAGCWSEGQQGVGIHVTFWEGCR